MLHECVCGAVMRYFKRVEVCRVVLQMYSLLLSRSVGATSTEQLHTVGYNLGARVSHAILVVPLTCAQLALDVNLSAFVNIFFGYFGQSTPQHHAVPFGTVGYLRAIGSRVSTFGCCHTQSCYTYTFFEVSYFGVGSDVSHQYNFVYRHKI